MKHGLHKCELKHKNVGEIQFEETVDERITEWPHSWPHGEITYRLNNFTTDISREDWQTRAVTVALRAWQLKVSKLKFKRERNPDVTVDFDVSFENLEHFDNKRGVLAHAYFPGQGPISGDVHINDDWDWVPATKFQMLSKPPLVPVLMHEFGHSLGLRHDPFDKTDIMYPSFNLGKEKYLIGNRSTERMQERYGKRGLSQWIQDYFNNRRLRGSDFR
tara:strand:- start:8290 stop:8943 length:654 start_codon:yes stop_codon:yes gene_type:complete